MTMCFKTADIKQVYRDECRHPAYVIQDEGKQKPAPDKGIPVKTLRAYIAYYSCPLSVADLNPTFPIQPING
jgi:hypothetical protein